MKTQFASVILAFLLLIPTAVKGAETAQAIQWEYKTYVQHLSPLSENEKKRIEKDLDELGRDGWELVSVVWIENNPGGTPTGKALCYFKRQKSPEGKEQGNR